MSENLALALGMAVAFMVLAWFALGTQANVRKGNHVLRWIQHGLPDIAERTTMRWLGSSVLELKMAKAKGPFRSAETLVVFEPRDVVFLWLWSRKSGRRDTLIFRSQLQTSPRYEIEVFDPTAWTVQGTERDVRNKNWTPLDLPATPSLRAYYSGMAAADAIKPLSDLAMQLGGALVRLSVHRDVPNLEVHVLLPDIRAASAQALFAKLWQIGESVARG